MRKAYPEPDNAGEFFFFLIFFCLSLGTVLTRHAARVLFTVRVEIIMDNLHGTVWSGLNSWIPICNQNLYMLYFC